MVSYDLFLFRINRIEISTRGTNSMPFLHFPMRSFAVLNG